MKKTRFLSCLCLFLTGMFFISLFHLCTYKKAYLSSCQQEIYWQEQYLEKLKDISVLREETSRQIDILNSEIKIENEKEGEIK